MSETDEREESAVQTRDIHILANASSSCTDSEEELNRAILQRRTEIERVVMDIQSPPPSPRNAHSVHGLKPTGVKTIGNLRLPLRLAVGGYMREPPTIEIHSAPTKLRPARGLPPPCRRCGTQQAVVPFHRAGFWICHGLEDDAYPSTEEVQYCGYTWEEDAVPRLCPKTKCHKSGLMLLECHFGVLGNACLRCKRFFPLPSNPNSPIRGTQSAPVSANGKQKKSKGL